MKTVEILRRSILFNDFIPEELVLLEEICETVHFISGESVYNENTVADALYIIKYGTVGIWKNGAHGTEEEVCELSTFGHFGEKSFIDGKLHAQSVICRENTTLLKIYYKDLDKFLTVLGDQTELKFYKSISQSLCNRIRQMSENLSTLKEVKFRRHSA